MLYVSPRSFLHVCVGYSDALQTVEGIGRSKKAAEHDAAGKALNILTDAQLLSPPTQHSSNFAAPSAQLQQPQSVDNLREVLAEQFVSVMLIQYQVLHVLHVFTPHQRSISP